MPKSGRSKGAKVVPHHPLVEALASDPNQPPTPAVRLFGFPGPATDPDSTRLWLDTRLQSFVDIADEAILHSRTLPDEEGTLLWVDPTASLTMSTSHAEEVQAQFLAGSIAEKVLPAVAALDRVKGAWTPTIWEPYFCNPTPVSFIERCTATIPPLCETLNPWKCKVKTDEPLGGPTGPPVTRSADCPSVNTPCNPVGPFRPQR
jgi:hypothetical protein